MFNLRLFLASLVIVILGGSPAWAEYISTVSVSFTNNTGVVVDGFHAYFDFPVDVIQSVKLISNAPGAGPLSITESDGAKPITATKFDLDWDTPGLPSGGSFVFRFKIARGIPSLIINGEYGPFWSQHDGTEIQVDLDRDQFQSIGTGVVPEPSALVLLGLGLLSLLGYHFWWIGGWGQVAAEPRSSIGDRA